FFVALSFRSFLSSCPFLFFFYLYGSHPYLHSFPTRRSSDLGDRRIRFASWDGDRRRLLGRSLGRDDSPRSQNRQLGVRSPRGRRDRKSTRLNSSHVEISYAVFCLKKKKRQAKPRPHYPH